MMRLGDFFVGRGAAGEPRGDAVCDDALNGAALEAYRYLSVCFFITDLPVGSYYGVRAVSRYTVMCEEGVEEGAQHAALGHTSAECQCGGNMWS